MSRLRFSSSHILHIFYSASWALTSAWPDVDILRLLLDCFFESLTSRVQITPNCRSLYNRVTQNTHPRSLLSLPRFACVSARMYYYHVFTDCPQGLRPTPINDENLSLYQVDGKGCCHSIQPHDRHLIVPSTTNDASHSFPFIGFTCTLYIKDGCRVRHSAKILLVILSDAATTLPLTCNNYSAQ